MTTCIVAERAVLAGGEEPAGEGGRHGVHGGIRGFKGGEPLFTCGAHAGEVGFVLGRVCMAPSRVAAWKIGLLFILWELWEVGDHSKACSVFNV